MIYLNEQNVQYINLNILINTYQNKTLQTTQKWLVTDISCHPNLILIITNVTNFKPFKNRVFHWYLFCNVIFSLIKQNSWFSLNADSNKNITWHHASFSISTPIEFNKNIIFFVIIPDLTKTEFLFKKIVIFAFLYFCL